MIISADDSELAGAVQPGAGLSGKALGPFALISHSSGDAVRQHTEQAPGLVMTLAVPEGDSMCEVQHDSRAVAQRESCVADQRESCQADQQESCAAEQQDNYAAEQHDSCPAEESNQGARVLGLEIALTPQAHFWLGKHGFASQAALTAAIKGLTDSLTQRQQ